MNEMVVNKSMKRTALDQPAAAATARPALIINAPRRHGTEHNVINASVTPMSFVEVELK